MPKAPAKPAPVPEHVLKKRKAQESIAAAKAAKMVEDKKASKIERKAIYDKAAKYMKEYKAMEKDVVEKRREAKKTGNFYMEPEPKLMLVVRIKGINAVAPKTRKILQLMRLRQVCCANTCLAPARPLARASLVLHPQRSREREVENALAICVTAGRSSLVAGYGIETQDGMSVLPWKCEEQRRVICSRSRGQLSLCWLGMLSEEYMWTVELHGIAWRAGKAERRRAGPAGQCQDGVCKVWWS